MSQGELIGTHKRLLFVGTARSASLPFDSVLDLTFGLDFMNVAMKDAETEIFMIAERIIGDSRFRETIVRLQMNGEIVAGASANELASIERRLTELRTILDADGRPKDEYLQTFNEGSNLLARMAELSTNKETTDTETVLFRAGCTLRILALHSAGLITSEEADRYWVEAGGQPYGVFSAEARERARDDPKIRRATEVNTTISSKGLLTAVLEYSSELADGRGDHLKRVVQSAIQVGGEKATDLASGLHWLAAEVAAWDAIDNLGATWEPGRIVATAIREFFQIASNWEQDFADAIDRERRIFDQFCASADDIHVARKAMAEQLLGAAPIW